MAPADTAAKVELMARLAASRAEIRHVLDPPPRHSTHDTLEVADGGLGGPHDGTFPRSRTMKLLLSGRGMGTAGALVGSLLIARPALAFKVLRLVPTGAVAKMLLVKAVAALRSK